MPTDDRTWTDTETAGELRRAAEIIDEDITLARKEIERCPSIKSPETHRHRTP